MINPCGRVRRNAPRFGPMWRSWTCAEKRASDRPLTPTFAALCGETTALTSRPGGEQLELHSFMRLAVSAREEDSSSPGTLGRECARK
jgi:hypothetical protein